VRAEKGIEAVSGPNDCGIKSSSGRHKCTYSHRCMIEGCLLPVVIIIIISVVRDCLTHNAGKS